MAQDPIQPEFLELLDNVLSAALREVRSLRARQPVVHPPAPPPSPVVGRNSHTTLCIDILSRAGRPLHISALLAAMADLGVIASRESVVSAVSKKLAPKGPFLRTGRNIFGLAGRDSLEEL